MIENRQRDSAAIKAIIDWVKAKEALNSLPDDCYLNPELIDKLVIALRRKNAAEDLLKQIAHREKP